MTARLAMTARMSLVAALVLTACSVSCILVVSPDDHGTRCRFAAEKETACSRCLTSRCSAEIDATCFDEGVLSIAEQCAVAGDDACNRVPASPLATCLQTRCNALCYAKTGASQTRCTESFVSAGLACSCTTSTTAPTDLACNSEVYPRTRCCAARGWPAPPAECTCNAVACVALSDGCLCHLTDNLDESTATDCKRTPDTHCCAVEERCQCRVRTCGLGEREVDVCNKAEITCPKNTVEVASCAIRQ
jgi:hypothetical protein